MFSNPLLSIHRPSVSGRRCGWPLTGSFVGVVTLLLLAFGVRGFAQGYSDFPPGSSRMDRVLLMVKQGVTTQEIERFEQMHTVQIDRPFKKLSGMAVLKTEGGRDLFQLMDNCHTSGLFEWVEPDYLVHASLTPNDPALVNGSSWGLKNIGIQGGSRGADIDTEKAWDIRVSARDIVVAVIDSGIRYTHEDLANNMWRNPGEIPFNNRDDDDNGVVDDVFGYNAVDDSGDPFDESGHGSHVAGIIGAVGNNSVGTTGVAWDAQLMGLKFLEDSGSGATSDAIRCIDYAIAHGAHIINASWGSGMRSRSLQWAISRARDEGLIFVTAAGNEGRDMDLTPDYPASYPGDNIVAVAATDRNDNLANTSNFGSTVVDLGAPGVDIYSAWSGRDNAYIRASGTSMAAPFVSGALALLKAEYPEKNYRDLIRGMLDSVDPVSGLTGKTVSGGRLNMAAALDKLKVSALIVYQTDIHLEISGGLVSLEIQAEPISDYLIQWSTDLTRWQTFSRITTDSQGFKKMDVSLGVGNQVFYRVNPVNES